MDKGVDKSCACVDEGQKRRPFDVNIQKSCEFLLFVREVCEKIVHVHIFWYH